MQFNFCWTSVLTQGRHFAFYIQSSSLAGPQPHGHCQAKAPFTISHCMRKVTVPRKGNLVQKCLCALCPKPDRNWLSDKGFSLKGNPHFAGLNKLCSWGRTIITTLNMTVFPTGPCCFSYFLFCHTKFNVSALKGSDLKQFVQCPAY